VTIATAEIIAVEQDYLGKVSKALIPCAGQRRNAMSAQAAQQFMEKLAANEDLLKQIDKDTAGKDSTAVLAAVVAAGKAQGFDFTAAEVQAGAMIHLKQQSGEQLTDQELAQVSGGMGSPAEMQAAAAAVAKARGLTPAAFQSQIAQTNTALNTMTDFVKRMQPQGTGKLGNMP
jgi:predicted ribosomally synthesized peptide with nif11-like leader